MVTATAEEIIKETGCSADQLERWIGGGWLAGVQSHYSQPGKRGPGIGLYSEETLDRARFFMEALDVNRDMVEAGYELFLQRQKLYKGEAYHRMLMLHNGYVGLRCFDRARELGN